MEARSIAVGLLLLEAAFLLLAITRLPALVRAARAHRHEGPIGAIDAGLRAAGLPGLLAGVAATEAAGLWLAVGGWFRRTPRTGLSMHRRNHWTTIAGLLMGLIIVESAAMHVALSTRAPIAAWISTGLSLYGVLWLAGDLHALRLYPLRVDAEALHVSVGLRWRLTIPRDAVARVVSIDANTVPPGALMAGVLAPTVVLQLARPVTARGPFGVRRVATAVALTVDDPDALRATLVRDTARPTDSRPR